MAIGFKQVPEQTEEELGYITSLRLSNLSLTMPRNILPLLVIISYSAFRIFISTELNYKMIFKCLYYLSSMYCLLVSDK